MYHNAIHADQLLLLRVLSPMMNLQGAFAVADGTDQLLRALGLEVKREPLRLNLGQGRQSRPISFQVERDLTAEDLLELGTLEAPKAPPIKELRDNHHAIAKMLATGSKPGEVSRVLGIGGGRISILQADPAFAELLAYYRDLSKEEYARHEADMARQLHSLGVDSIATLHERLLEEPDRFTAKDLASIITLTADRSGHGPTATVNNNVTHSLDEAALARIRAGTPPERVQVVGEADKQRLLGLAVRATELHPDAQEAEWSPCEGDGVRAESGGDAHGEVAGPDPLPPVDNVP